MTPKGSAILKYYTIIFRVIETEQQRKNTMRRKTKVLDFSPKHTLKNKILPLDVRVELTLTLNFTLR